MQIRVNSGVDRQAKKGERRSKRKAQREVSILRSVGYEPTAFPLSYSANNEISRNS